MDHNTSGIGLAWVAGSYYRLRDARLAAHITSVEADQLRGQIGPVARLKWINGSPSLDSSAVCSDGEWDLNGECRRNPAHDLMELIR